MISKTDVSSSDLRWGGFGKTVPDIVTTRTQSIALLDFDGVGNTSKILNYLTGTNDGYADGAPAAEACANYTFPSGTKGYLPAMGEWQAVLDNKTSVDTALTLIGGSAIQSSYYWASTQVSDNQAWRYTTPLKNWYNWDKPGIGSIRAFTAL